MSEYGWLALYSLLIPLASLLGGYLPFRGRVSHSTLQFYLSASAGVMLGASFFHVMPDAFKMCEKVSEGYFGWWMSLAVVGLFCIERFIAPHSHEVNGAGHQRHNKNDHDHSHEHEHDHNWKTEHVSASVDPKEQRAAAPAVAGWAAVIGLTIHTFMNGVGLAGAVHYDFHPPEGNVVAWLLPGWAIFLAIILHKPADALAISTVLSRKGTNRQKIKLVQVGFALMVPVGVLAFTLTEGAIGEDMKNQLTGAALAFSAGTFLFIALSDLLPEVQFHGHDRLRLFLTLTAAVALMGGIAWLEKLATGAD